MNFFCSIFSLKFSPTGSADPDSQTCNFLTFNKCYSVISQIVILFSKHFFKRKVFLYSKRMSNSGSSTLIQFAVFMKARYLT